MFDGIVLVVMLAGFGFSAVFLAQGVSSLRSWDRTYGPTAAFTVEACSTTPRPIGNQVVCAGHLVPDDDGRPVSSKLVGSLGSFGSAAPEPGAVVDAYYRSGDTSRAFPQGGRTTELARALFGYVPFLFLVGGLACWLLGWVLTRNITRADAERRSDHYLWPQRFVLRPRGALWALVGVGWLVVDRLAIDRIIGLAGLG